MNKYEIIGRLLVTHNQCENQFSELGKGIDNIINQIVVTDTDINPSDVLLVMSKFRMLENLIKDYRSELDNILMNGDIDLTGIEMD